MFFLNETESKQFYAVVLLACLLFDTLVMRLPFTETVRVWGRMNEHFSLNLMIAASTLMAAGFE